MRPQSFALELVVMGAIIFCLTLPLIWRKVPRNRWYGVRLREAFSSEQRWYDINAYGGRILARWSIPIIVVGLAGFFVPLTFFFTYCCIAGCIVLVSMFAPLIQILRWVKATRQT